MTGNFGGALEARGIPSHPEKLTAKVEGDIERIDGKTYISKIRVHRLQHRVLKVVAPKIREAKQRVRLHRGVEKHLARHDHNESENEKRVVDPQLLQQEVAEKKYRKQQCAHLSREIGKSDHDAGRKLPPFGG